MIRCDACKGQCQFVSFVGGVALCRQCIKPWDLELMSCRSPQAYQDLVRRIRRQILGDAR